MKAEATEKAFLGLRRSCAAMGLLHRAQSTVMIVVSNDPKYPTYSNFLRFDGLLARSCLTRNWRTNCASVRRQNVRYTPLVWATPR